jgi:GNAT superfamily N-acetyltransferase
VRDEGEVAAVAGVQVITNLYYERHLYVYELVATAGARSKGHGAALMSYVEYLARREECNYVALACGREREGALRFYERLGFERLGYSMRKTLR